MASLPGGVLVSGFQDFSFSAFKESWPNRYDRSRVLKEYVKILYYWVAYGIPPWGKEEKAETLTAPFPA